MEHWLIAPASILSTILIQHIFNRFYNKPQKVAVLAIITNLCIYNTLFVVFFAWDKALFLGAILLLSHYIYFHIFNMSETSRRIRLLAIIAEQQPKNTAEIANFYQNKDLISVRLQRLQELGQIRKVEGRYFSTSFIFPSIAFILEKWRQLLG